MIPNITKKLKMFPNKLFNLLTLYSVGRVFFMADEWVIKFYMLFLQSLHR